MKTLTVLQQINMLVKHANRNGLTITFFNVDNNNCVFANVHNANKDEYSYKTVFCLVDECEYIFNLIP